MATIRGATAATRATSRILTTARPRVARARAAVPAAVRQLNTINQDEISHFSRLSQHWWDEAGEFALLHRMNPERVEYIRQKVALDPRTEPEWTFEGRHGDRARAEARGAGRWLEGKRCLDVGCGGGLLAETLARLGGDVVAIDASGDNIAIARTHASADPLLPYVGEDGSAPANVPGRLEYRHTSAEALRAAGETFDLVCSMEVLEHVDQPGEFLKCLGDMVRPGGDLVMSTISRTPLSQLLTITLAEDLLRFVTPGTHTYRKFVRPEELRRFVYADMGGHAVWEPISGAADIREGEVGETQGIIYDPLGARWRLWPGAEGTWQKGLGEIVNYMYHAKKKA
ncbi:Ubiquinone biosynthesis O-methyltransferase, mitochondrial [Vanrija pseudolonga]|uniref:Ubiquinone biosynthesis O-methyltransferase, mitochondrial n=1 Tax=Vanrija pseudolonga TaxID=143232 RepID=A0AAF1BHB1_9TREE|nr:Ubiquinone biosynthesis O-methyltransferase, mitochondrial [Vanrija pseudolonga]